MGWSWRRSVSFGPVRFNFSKSGVGMSFGVRGARISTGPRGTYVNVGAGGFRYSHRLGDSALGKGRVPSTQPANPPTSRFAHSTPRQVPSAGQNRNVVGPASLVDTSADELLEEIRRKRQVLGLLPLILGVSALGFVSFLILLQAEESGVAQWAMLSLGILGLVAAPWASWRDRKARLVRVHYAFDPLGSRVQESVARLVGALQSAQAIWIVNEAQFHGDWKRNAGATTSVARRPVRSGWGSPPFLETNARIGALDLGGTCLYFFPDRVLFFGRADVQSVRYSELNARAGNVHFSEEDHIPHDAKVIGKTWRYVNKSGGPDRRFNNNYQIPIVLYGTLEMSTPSGLRLGLQTSSDTTASEVAAHLREIKASVEELERRRAAGGQPPPLPEFVEEPPPISLPSRKILALFGALVTFRWLDQLPGWAAPIAWGLLMALPPVALIVWLSARGPATAFFVFTSFTLAGGWVGRLLFRFIQRGRAARLERASASRSRFRAVLANELRVHPLEAVKFSELVTESDIARKDADQIADELLLRVIVKFLADGILSDQERTKLAALASALEVDDARRERLEEEAKTVRYGQAVSDALADGTVTSEEARMLNELQSRFGIGGSRWTPGDLGSCR